MKFLDQVRSPLFSNQELADKIKDLAIKSKKEKSMRQTTT
jgi:hypothetical protein